ncbi:hypothetical protein GCM10009849_33140 [Sinomonas flava]|uniref:Short chain dehydrogenase n=1 Tax=Sinomonas flava TaxID=496857 RepID=A0ABP5NX45_9MICC
MDAPPQDQEAPGTTAETTPQPDHGEQTYEGHGRLRGKAALITGGDSGIGRAVGIAFAREGADVAFTFQPTEKDDADAAVREIEAAGRTAVAIEGDLRDEDFSASLPQQVREKLGRLDVIVLNAAYQQARDGVDTVSTEEFDRVLRTNLYSQFWILRSALPPPRVGSVDHHHQLDPVGAALGGAVRLRHDQGGSGSASEGIGTPARPAGHPHQRGGSGARLDPPHPVHRLA